MVMAAIININDGSRFPEGGGVGVTVFTTTRDVGAGTDVATILTSVGFGVTDGWPGGVVGAGVEVAAGVVGEGVGVFDGSGLVASGVIVG